MNSRDSSVHAAAGPGRQEKSTQHKAEVEAAIRDLPTLGSPAFWEAVKPVDLNAPLLPAEALAWAIRQYILGGQEENAHRVFEILYLRYNTWVEKQAHYHCYSPVGSYFKGTNLRRELAAEMASEVWTTIFRKLSHPDPDYEPYYLKNFRWKLVQDLKTIAGQVAENEGFIGNKAVPAQNRQSLDAPVNYDGAEGLSLAELVEDEKAGSEYIILEYENLFAKRLDPRQKKIVTLLAERHKKAEIARIIGVDPKVITRSIEVIRRLIKDETG